MLEKAPSPIPRFDEESSLQDLIGLNPTRRSPKKVKLHIYQPRNGLESVLHNLSKQKIYNGMMAGIQKQQPRLHLYYMKLLNQFNQSTVAAKKNSKKRQNALNKQYRTLSLYNPQGQSNRSNPKPKGVTFSKQLISKKQVLTLPAMKSTSLKDQDINPKDKRIQDLFLKIGKKQGNQFVYDVLFPKKLLLDFISQQFSPKFSSYFNWFMELRPTIDYYYYVSIGNKFLKMDIHKIAHFAYSAFDGFSYQNSLQIFMNDYGSSDLMTIIDNRDQFREMSAESVNYFQRKTLSELDDSKPMVRTHRTMIKSNTVYRRTFLFKQLNGSQEMQKKVQGQTRKRGQITFDEFCGVYCRKVPSIYKQILRKLYFIQIIDSQKGVSLDRREQFYNRDRNITRQSMSLNRNKQKIKRR